MNGKRLSGIDLLFWAPVHFVRSADADNLVAIGTGVLAEVAMRHRVLERITRRLCAVPAHVYVVLAAALAGLVAAGVIAAWVFWYGTPIVACPVDPHSEDWVLSCRITEAGTAEANEDFSGAGLEGDGRNRGADDVERGWPGTRIKVRVKVTRKRGLKPGRYVLYGTVTRLDLSKRRVELTDCVFIPDATESGRHRRDDRRYERGPRQQPDAQLVRRAQPTNVLHDFVAAPLAQR